MSDLNALFQESAHILCLDAPARLEFGVDMKSWETGPKFQGVKLIPEGIHCIHYSINDRYGGAEGARLSFFIDLKPQDVVVLRWDPSLEEFEYLNETKPDEAERYRLGVLRYDFDSTMGPYPISDTESRAAWLRLTNNITPDVLFRLEPIGKLMRARSKPLTPEEEQSIATASSIPHSDGPQATSSQQHDSVVKPGPGPRTPASSSSIYYTEIPKRFPSNEPIDPSALTKLNMDKTALLDLIVRRYFKNDIFMLLGEMQFSFLSFLLGQSFESFEQWKDIVQLLCSCEDGIGTHSKFFIAFMDCFEAQLAQVPSDFFVDVLSGVNFLTPLLKGFFELALDESVDAGVAYRARRLQSFLDKHFGVGWLTTHSIHDSSADPSLFSSSGDYYVPSDDYEPVVVTLKDNATL